MDKTTKSERPKAYYIYKNYRKPYIYEEESAPFGVADIYDFEDKRFFNHCEMIAESFEDWRKCLYTKNKVEACVIAKSINHKLKMKKSDEHAKVGVIY